MSTTATLTVNGFNIVLPVGLPEVLATPVRDSYQVFLKDSVNDVRRHLTCASTLLPPEMEARFGQNVLHAFGGLGATAQILDQCAPGLTHMFWERDPVCVDYLRSQYDNVLQVKDSFELFQRSDLSDFDVLLMDMSVGTIKTTGVKSMWAKIADWFNDHPNGFVWFTDTACHKIHLNYKTYAKDFGTPVGSTAESYLNAYASWLERLYGLTITASMREAGEFYSIVKRLPAKRFQAIPYV